MEGVNSTLTQANIVNVKPLQTIQQDFVHQSTTQLQQLEPHGTQRCGGNGKPTVTNIEDGDEQEEEDDDYDDDDDEKENSQKLVIDINEDEELEEEDDEKDIMEQNEVGDIELTHNIAQETLEKDLLNASSIGKPLTTMRVDEVETIITLSDAEEEISAVDAMAKPGKIQKRKSVGAPLVCNEEERFRLKRRKINVEGAPKMPLTGK